MTQCWWSIRMLFLGFCSQRFRSEIASKCVRQGVGDSTWLRRHQDHRPAALRCRRRRAARVACARTAPALAWRHERGQKLPASDVPKLHELWHATEYDAELLLCPSAIYHALLCSSVRRIYFNFYFLMLYPIVLCLLESIVSVWNFLYFVSVFS